MDLHSGSTMNVGSASRRLCMTTEVPLGVRASAAEALIAVEDFRGPCELFEPQLQCISCICFQCSRYIPVNYTYKITLLVSPQAGRGTTPPPYKQLQFFSGAVPLPGLSYLVPADIQHSTGLPKATDEGCAQGNVLLFSSPTLPNIPLEKKGGN